MKVTREDIPKMKLQMLRLKLLRKVWTLVMNLLILKLRFI